MFTIKTIMVEGYEFEIMLSMGGVDGILVSDDQVIDNAYTVALKKVQLQCRYFHAEWMLLNHGLNRNLDLPALMKKIFEGRQLGYLQPSEQIDLLIEAYYNPDEVKLAKREIPRKLSGWVYVVKSADGHCKIGRTGNLETRIKALKANHIEDIEIVHTIKTDDMFDLETTLHSHFANKRVKGEWFNLAPKDIEFIKGL
jgi:Meiotically Up-regulated Gene 113 (MUG113) protein